MAVFSNQERFCQCWLCVIPVSKIQALLQHNILYLFLKELTQSLFLVLDKGTIKLKVSVSYLKIFLQCVCILPERV